jgi:hypothetical protein
MGSQCEICVMPFAEEEEEAECRIPAQGPELGLLRRWLILPSEDSSSTRSPVCEAL